jgi:hypothetical protein
MSARRRIELNWAWRTGFLAFLMMSLTGNLLHNKVLWVSVGVGILLRRRPDVLADSGSASE